MLLIVEVRAARKDLPHYKEPEKIIFMSTYPSIILSVGTGVICCSNELVTRSGIDFLGSLVMAPMAMVTIYLVAYGLQSLCCQFTDHIKGAIWSAWILEILFAAYLVAKSKGL